jgi:hypothetical protein
LNLTPAQLIRNVRFYGLSASTSYTFSIYGARDATETRITTYSILNDSAGSPLDSGTLTTSGTGIGSSGENYNNDALLALTATTDADGELFLQYQATTGSFGYLNAVQITQEPEPSTFALLAIAASGLIFLRRRK